MEIDDTSVQDFLKWFQNAQGTLNDAVGITQFPEMSRGAIALHDIPKDSTLFTIPRDALLSTRTSSLRKLLGEHDWKSLGSGWQPLMVSMMWEESRGDASPWSGYLRDLPAGFDTLMFWSSEQLAALQASTIKDKIGKAEAERDYHERVLPLLQRRSEIFDPSLLSTFFTLERFHINGTQQDDDHEAEPQADVSEEPQDNGETQLEDLNQMIEGDEDEEDEEEEEGMDDVAMVPMADILNARYGCNNAKLFYEKEHLRMVAIKDIKAGDQIWNTYGEPPNAHLLRRYGYVDIIPCEKQAYIFPFENPADEVEIRADLVMDICLPSAQAEERMQKIDTWLTLGGDDTFAIDDADPMCKPMLGMIRYLSMNKEEVEEAISKEKLPKGKATGDTLKKAVEIFRARLAQYPTSIENDENWLRDFTGAPGRVYNATFVRLGEKRLLKHAINKAEAVLQAEKPANVNSKRGREGSGTTGGGKKKIKR